MGNKASLKLNIGCGAKSNKAFSSESNWIKIDLVAGNVRADALSLPFKDESFSEARAIHVLEHVKRSDHTVFLSEIHRVLQPEGVFYVEVPNLLEICKKLVALGKNSAQLQPVEKEMIRRWTLSIYGKHRHVGDAHNWGFMPYLLKEDLEKHSFQNITQLTKREDMISTHYRMEPIILFRGTK